MPLENSARHDGVSVEYLREALRVGLAVVTELWSYTADDWISCVHAADIDGDGDIEILASSRDGNVYILTKRGGLKWRFDGSKGWVGAVLGIDNFMAKSEVRIIAGSRDNTIYALNKTGHIEWKRTIDMVIRQILVQDINQDGKDEVIVGSEDQCVYVLDCTTGELLWQYATDGWIRTVFAADIDGDGQIEILAGSGDTYLYVLDNQGHLKWKHDTKSRIHTLFVKDLDGDGIVEIIIGSDAKDLYVLTPDREIKWKFEPENRILSIFVADLDNDGHMEVIAGSEDKHLYFLNDKGKLLWKHNVSCRIFSIYAIDFDHDGIPEILVGAEDDSVRALRVELTENLRSKIINYHTILKRLPPSELKFLLTEEALLRDITEDSILSDRSSSLEQASQQLQAGQFLEALSNLLLLKQKKVQCLWTEHIGYVRTICFDDFHDDVPVRIVVGTHEGKVHVLNEAGEIVWSYTLVDQERVWTVQVADADHDGNAEIMVGSASGNIYALNSTGTSIRWQDTIGKDWITSINIANKKQNGYTNTILGLKGRNGRVRFYDEKLAYWTEPIELPSGVRALYIYDTDQDGIAEIIAGTDDYSVYIHKSDGKRLWSYETHDRVRGLCAGDIDGDGEPEIIVGSEDRLVHVLNSTGHLKWLYYTPHRVLDVTMLDIDQDEKIEILIGDGDGYLYVLNGVGDLLWKFKTNDRVRVVRVYDVDRDGNMEIAVASEDTLYLLRVVNQQQVQDLIEQCWTSFCSITPEEDRIYELSQHQDPYLRAFALKLLVAQPNILEKDFDTLRILLNDPEKDVRCEFAHQVAPLYQAYPEKIRRFLEGLAADRESAVRLAFVDSLPEITSVNQEVGFEYLERFTKNVDRWVRHAVVRKLYILADKFPQQVFRLLSITAQDKANWIKQESARSFARYFDIHTDKLIRGTRSLIVQGIDFSTMELIRSYATKPIVKDIFRVLVDLCSDLNEANVEERLSAATEAFEKARTQFSGEEIWQLYQELYRLHRMHTIHEIARYKLSVDQTHVGNITYFEDTLKILEQLVDIVKILRLYQKRDGLGDRLASLLEAITKIEQLLTEMRRESPMFVEQKSMFADRLILDLLLTKWRTIITVELVRLRDKARITPELQTKTVQKEEQVAIWLCLHNEGNSPADHVRVELVQGQDFDICSSNIVEFEEVSSRGEKTAEFAIKPHVNSFNLEFNITYGDAEARDKVLSFGDHLDLVENLTEFKPIPNLYTSGTPVHDAKMFYGREEDLEFLRKNLATDTNNMVIILYGPRRSGKTSLLYQLLNTSILEPHIPIYIDLQNESYKMSISNLMRSMAFTICKALRKKNIEIEYPGVKDFEEDPIFIFNLFLDSVKVLLGERRLVILIDEFEILEQEVARHSLDPEIFEYLRSLMQHRQYINFMVAGTHKIEQLTAGYRSVFFNIARHHPLKKLSEKAATQLIVQPVQGYLKYDPFAVKKIRQLTADQPYLIHLVCRSLVEHCNELQKAYATINDVNTILEGVIETGKVQFGWIWDQISLSERLALSAVSQESKHEESLVSLTDIEETYRHFGQPFNRKKVLEALQKLINADVIISGPDGTQFRVLMDLTRLWLQRNKSLARVMLEENLLPE